MSLVGKQRSTDNFDYIFRVTIIKQLNPWSTILIKTFTYIVQRYLISFFLYIYSFTSILKHSRFLESFTSVICIHKFS